MNLVEELYSRFGYPTFRSGQQEVLETFLTGHDVLAVLPTGTGKSLLYQFPSIYFSGTVVIVSPLVSLMIDQVEQLKKSGVKETVAFTSFQTVPERKYALAHMNSYKYIFVSPEILQNEAVRRSIQSLHIAYFVLDEAHCLVQWGVDFRPDYLRSVEWLRQTFSKQLLALTATANAATRKEIKELLKSPSMVEIVSSVDRPSIALETIEVKNERQKGERLMEQVLTYEGPGIVYVQSRIRAEELARELAEHGVKVAAYHGGMGQEDRRLIQQQFMLGNLEWICATNAFGMGIHKDNIRQVIHDHIPTSLSNYMQEIGRASRDGIPSLATLYYIRSDQQKSRFVAMQDLPTKEDILYYLEHPDIQLPEQQQRILDYWKTKLSGEEIVSLFEGLQQKKEKEIQTLYELISSPKCIRESIVHVFDGQLEERPIPCCNRCGETRQDLTKRKSHHKTHSQFNWRDRLQRIFP